jgi:hypothetical protein
VRAVIALACAAGDPANIIAATTTAMEQAYDEGFDVGRAVGSGVIEELVGEDVAMGETEDGDTTEVRASGVVRTANYDAETEAWVRKSSCG